MDEVQVDVLADPDLDDPVLVEGLPGVGQVGKLAVEHLVEQVTVDDDGVSTLAGVAFYAIETDEQDLLALSGDYQASGMAGHYRLAERFLDIGEEFDVSEIVTLGGVPTGEMQEEYAVVGAVNETGDRGRFEDGGVDFYSDEPTGGIVGTSGLLLGLGDRRDIPATCLMGETSGYLVDPRSSKAVLSVLDRVLGIEVDFTTLEERAAQLEEFLAEFQEQNTQGPQSPGDEDLRYFG